MSAHVAVIARITVRPDAVDDAEAALRRLVDAAADEPGTALYVLNREADAPTFWFYELYDDDDALAVHGKSPVLAEAFGTLGSLLAEPPDLRIVRPVQAKGLDL